MTLTILARDPATGALGGASMTGNLCVGAWVLRGDLRGGLSASQGKTPSTLWGEDLIDAMRLGEPASEALSRIANADAERSERQALALDRDGNAAAFTGAENTPVCHDVIAHNLVVGGNMLADAIVVNACAEEFAATNGLLAYRLLAALGAGSAKGGDYRGLVSAALLVLDPDTPPLNLRIDYSIDPLGDLHDLLHRTQSSGYKQWLKTLPTRRASDQ